jgi:hypothetical protein
MAPGMRRTNLEDLSFLQAYEDFRKKAGQAGIISVGRTGLKGNDCIRMANGPASSSL